MLSRELFLVVVDMADVPVEELPSIEWLIDPSIRWCGCWCFVRTADKRPICRMNRGEGCGKKKDER
jgi:hypothetical protein